MKILQYFMEGYHDIDPRMKTYYLVRSPYPLIVLLGSYLYFCLKAGPGYMENRKPYQLKNTLIVYNGLQVLMSCYLAFRGTAIWSGFNWYCEPIDYSENSTTNTLLHLGFMYFFAKITELLDTVFFVLRKKYNQISFLHLFHHTVMPTFSWIGLRYFAGGHGTLFGVINSYVHIVMYAYYLIAGLGPQYKKYLWWKKHVTIMQLIQFGIIFIHNFFPLFTSCSYPKHLHILVLIFSSFFFYMFSDFYYRTYVKKPIKQNAVKKD